LSPKEKFKRFINSSRKTSLTLAWPAISRRKKRTIISIILLSFVIGSSITIASTIQQFPAWVSALSGASPTVLLSYEKNSQFSGLLPTNSTIPISDSNEISQISGVTDVTPLVIKDVSTSLSANNPSIIVGLDINFWELGFGLNSGHWPKPNSTEAVIALASSSGTNPNTVTIQNQVFSVVGIALTSNLALANSIIISYSTAQELFSLSQSASVFVIQLNSNVDPTYISNQIDQTDLSFSTLNLSGSSQVLNTVNKVIGSISSTVIFAEGVFAFAILTTLTVSNIHTRKWEYGLISSYGGKRSVFKLILLENLLVYGLALLPAFLIGIGVLGFFIYYFNSLFGVGISWNEALLSSFANLRNSTTILNYLAALIATTLGSILAIRIVLPGILSRALVDQQS
jgi:hypothetical protein